ncbi:MAG: hypothetical protein U1F49_05535 [Rubrivivax sp.]
MRLAREDDGVGLCAGAWLGGMRAALICQNSALLLAANVLAAMAHHHQIPFLVLAAQRGSFDDNQYYQMYKGRVAEPLLSALGLPYHVIDGPRTSTSCSTAHARPTCAGSRWCCCCGGARWWAHEQRRIEAGHDEAQRARTAKCTAASRRRTSSSAGSVPPKPHSAACSRAATPTSHPTRWARGRRWRSAWRWHSRSAACSCSPATATC